MRSTDLVQKCDCGHIEDMEDIMIVGNKSYCLGCYEQASRDYLDYVDEVEEEFEDIF